MLNLHFIPVGGFVGSICKQISLTLRRAADAVPGAAHRPLILASPGGGTSGKVQGKNEKSKIFVVERNNA